MGNTWEHGKSISDADNCVSKGEMRCSAPAPCCGAAASVSEPREGGMGRKRQESVCVSKQERSINAFGELVGFPELLPGRGYTEISGG